MQGRDVFSQHEAREIRALLQCKTSANRSDQKRIRGKLRRDYHFYITDFGVTSGFEPSDFDYLVSSGRVKIVDAGQAPMTGTKAHAAARPEAAGQIAHSGRDEAYIIDLCDKILGRRASRQHHFHFLVGDTGKPLPVDAYYPALSLAIEYHERQHTESVKLFDRREQSAGFPEGSSGVSTTNGAATNCPRMASL
jgi:hypothetical protein